MNKLINKTTSILLTLTMIFLVIPTISINSSASIVDSGKCGDNLFWSLDDTGTLIIYGEGNMYDYEYQALNHTSTSPFWENQNKIKNIIIKSGAKNIGEYAFFQNGTIIDVVIPDSVTRIGDYSFSGCRSLTNIEIPDNVTTIGAFSFAKCEKITSINISNNVTSIGPYAFSGCIGITDLTISNGARGFENGIFNGCIGLSSITLPVNVSIHSNGMFENCTGLTNVNIPYGVEIISYDMFSNCINLTNISIPKSVTDIHNRAFKECVSLTKLTLLNNVKNIGTDCFLGCEDLTITCYKGSHADVYTTKNNITVIYICNEHVFKNYINDNNSKCNKDGTKTAICENCNETDTIIDEDSALGHSFIDYISNNNATCTRDATKTSKCNRCDTINTVVDEGSALGHTRGEWVITKEATVDSEGEQVRYCTVCNTELEKETIEKLPAPISFIDVKPTAWYAEGVNYCATKGYITGVGNNKFNPDGKLTREQFVVILARIAGADLTKYTSTDFTDVKVNLWYGPSVIWANESGYVNGVGKGKFGVGQNIDRESLATLFYRYAQKQGIDTKGKANLSTYSDYAKISSWSTDACAWAVNAGLLSSTNTKVLTLSPKMTVTRAQAAKIFMSYDNIQ